jgi:F-type H+-transporting ATPase subunit gamma
VERGLHVVLNAQEVDGQLPPSRPAQRTAAIVFGTDYGLCGRFNEEITDHAVTRMATICAESGGGFNEPRVLAVGARVASSLAQSGQAVEKTTVLPASAAQISFSVQALTMQIDAWQLHGDVHAVYLFYNRPMRDQRYVPVGFKIWPVDLSRFKQLEEARWPSRSLPVFTMNSEQLLAHLLRQYLFVSLFRACAESQASEHASRLSSMQIAERNLDEHLAESTAQYRRVRQESITAELLDVISGYEAITHG